MHYKTGTLFCQTVYQNSFIFTGGAVRRAEEEKKTASSISEVEPYLTGLSKTASMNYHTYA